MDWNSVPYQTSHNKGGAMGADPTASAVRRCLQSWDVSNLFVEGASAFPQNTAKNPSGPWLRWLSGLPRPSGTAISIIPGQLCRLAGDRRDGNSNAAVTFGD
jgi:hypothetical protein